MINLESLYSEKYMRFDGVKSLGWGSEYSQFKRFKVLLEIDGYKDKDSVLDFGCGYGDLSNIVDNYTGIDIRNTAIEVARRKYPNKKFILGSLTEVNENYEWIFASGIFCFKENWENNLKETLGLLFEKCQKGIAFNLLSDLTNGNRDKDMKYTKIDDVLNTLNTLSNSFTIRHDYLPNDFTVYLYKKI